MFEEWGSFKRETLTETAQLFKFPQYKLLDLWRSSGAVNANLSGIYAKWKTVQPDDTLDKDFVAPETQAQPMDLNPRGEQQAQMLITFKKKGFPAEFLNNYDEAEGIVADELMLMRKVSGDLLDEFMLAQALQGSISITYDGQSVSLSTGIPGANSTTAASAWSNASTDIGADVAEDMALVDGYGYEFEYAITTRKVFNALRKNQVVRDYLARTGQGEDAIIRGEIKDLFGLTWIRHDSTYKLSGSRTRFLTEGHVIYIPRPSREWTEFQIGKVAMGGGDQVGQGVPSFPMVNGFAAWFEKTGDPPGFQLYGRYARLPVFKQPGVIVNRDTGIT